ncbi:MAG: hypothetical protein LBD56_00970 [Endomicrobium sp.]|jgi:hypothetical protein|nr:hypothetical protein [Endomicrobium sp.]
MKESISLMSELKESLHSVHCVAKLYEKIANIHHFSGGNEGIKLNFFTILYQILNTKNARDSISLLKHYFGE